MRALRAKLAKLSLTSKRWLKISTSPLFLSGSKNVSAGVTETITFTLPTDAFIVHLTELYADARADMTYQWCLEGEIESYNHIIYVGGKPLHRSGNRKLILRLTNSGSETRTISYYVMGYKEAK